MSVHPTENHHTGSLDAVPLNGRHSENADSAIILESRADAEILHVFGEADLTSVDGLRTAIDQAAAGGLHVIVDLAPCSYIDSTILNMLVRANEAYSGRFQIVVPADGIVRRVFTITSLITQLPVTEAIDGLGA